MNGKKIKFIFLDIDGVLNNGETTARTPFRFIGIDDGNLKNLGIILSRVPEASIILSSSWKGCWDEDGNPDQDGRYLLDALGRKGYEIADFTSDIEGEHFSHCFYSRGAGIRRYLEGHENDGFVILDDENFDFDREGLETYHVKPDYSLGLTKEDAEKAVRILNSENLAFPDSGHASDMATANLSAGEHKGRKI